MYLMLARLAAFVRREEGQDLLEYALLVALIAIACVAAIKGASGAVQQAFSDIAAAI